MSHHTFYPIILDGLVYYLDFANDKSYPGSGTASYDLATTNSIAVLTNGPSFDGGGGGNIVLDGINDYINAGNNSGVGITGSLTITAWVKPTDFSNFNGILSKTGVGGSNTNLPAPYDYYLSQSSGIPSFLRGNGNSTSFGVDLNSFSGTSAPTAGRWNFLAVTMFSGNNGLVTHYLNGNINGSGTLSYTNACVDGGNVARVGSRTDGATMLKGGVACVSVYNRELSSDEILHNYNATKKRFL